MTARAPQTRASSTRAPHPPRPPITADHQPHCPPGPGPPRGPHAARRPCGTLCLPRPPSQAHPSRAPFAHTDDPHAPPQGPVSHGWNTVQPRKRSTPFPRCSCENISTTYSKGRKQSARQHIGHKPIFILKTHLHTEIRMGGIWKNIHQLTVITLGWQDCDTFMSNFFGKY